MATARAPGAQLLDSLFHARLQLPDGPLGREPLPFEPIQLVFERLHLLAVADLRQFQLLGQLRFLFRQVGPQQEDLGLQVLRLLLDFAGEPLLDHALAIIGVEILASELAAPSA